MHYCSSFVLLGQKSLRSRMASRKTVVVDQILVKMLRRETPMPATIKDFHVSLRRGRQSRHFSQPTPINPKYREFDHSHALMTSVGAFPSEPNGPEYRHIVYDRQG
jgi:hypothetical protein